MTTTTYTYTCHTCHCVYSTSCDSALAERARIAAYKSGRPTDTVTCCGTLASVSVETSDDGDGCEVLRPMTFETWRNTRTGYRLSECPPHVLDNIGAQLDDPDFADVVAVHVYDACGCFILETHTGYHLPLEREEHDATNLIDLERILHRWAVVECDLEEPATK